MSGHPADVAFLDTVVFTTSRLRAYCDRCDNRRPTVAVGHIEASSGPGYEIRHCRICVGVYLARARAATAGLGGDHQPALPKCG